MSVTDDDDRHLDAILAAGGVRMNARQVRDLVAGVAAAPPGHDPDGWMLLVADQPTAELREALAALLAVTRSSAKFSTLPDTRSRLAAVRAELRKRRLAGLVVPRGDEHQGEYVAASSERLAWLTSFTGSAGTAVVLRDRAAVFVDGRYTVQAAAEVDTALFEIRHSMHEPLDAWLHGVLPPKARLGYDPWLHTPRQAAALARACARAGGRAVPVHANPVDAVWHDRPPQPLAPVVVHEEILAGHPAEDKRQRVAEIVRKEHHDAAFIAQPDSLAWLLNVRGGDVPFTPLPLAFAILHADGGVMLFIDERKLTHSVRGHLGSAVTIAPQNALGTALDALGAARRTVRLDPDGAPQWVAQRLAAAGAVVIEAADPCLLPKATKTAAELAGIRAAHVRDGAALSRFLAWIDTAQVGGRVRESAAAARLLAFRAEGDRYRGPSFPTISAAGSNGAIVHYRVTPATDRLLEENSLYLVDSGGQYLDGTTDVTRTVAIGTPSGEMRERFTLVLKGHIALATACFTRGTTGSQLDALARAPLWRAGLDYDHGTGHGVGCYLGVHEGPQRISKLPSRVPLQPGMVISNEPGYYKTGAYGIRIENLVAVQALDPPAGGEQELLGFETLTLAPIDRRLVVGEMLDEAEAAWLNAYHARVRDVLSPLVDRPTRGWLERATRPV